MLRITVVSQTSEEVVLKVEGWVSDADVELLKQEITNCFQKARGVAVDLTNVRFIDKAGIELLRGWFRNGLVLRGSSPFVRTLLEAYGL